MKNILVVYFIIYNYLVFDIFNLHHSNSDKPIFTAEAETLIFHSDMQFIDGESFFISKEAEN